MTRGGRVKPIDTLAALRAISDLADEQGRWPCLAAVVARMGYSPRSSSSRARVGRVLVERGLVARHGTGLGSYIQPTERGWQMLAESEREAIG